MATSAATAAHVLDALAGAGDVRVRKMFGEYAVYLDGKVVALICDDQLFVKPTPGALRLASDAVLAVPYPGMRPALLVTDDLDDSDRMTALLRAAWLDLPQPKPKATRRKA